MNSTHSAYASVAHSVDISLVQKIKECIASGTIYPASECLVRFYFLSDREKVLSSEDFANFPTSPFERNGSYWFIFAGFVCEIKFGFISLAKRKMKGVLNGGASVFVDSLDFLDIPELAANLREGVKKHQAGNSSVNLN